VSEFGNSSLRRCHTPPPPPSPRRQLLLQLDPSQARHLAAPPVPRPLRQRARQQRALQQHALRRMLTQMIVLGIFNSRGLTCLDLNGV